MPKLKRELGLLECTLAGVGIIIGAGIYAIIGKATAIAGNEVWLSFIFAAIAAIFTGLSYAELSSMFSHAGGEFEYSLKVFGKKTAFVTGWLMLFAGLVGSAAVSLGFAGYLSALVGFPALLLAIALIVLCSIINYVGIKQSTGIADIITVLESLGLVAIIILGVAFFSSFEFTLPTEGFTNVMSAASLIFFAFLGFEGIVKLSEETKNAEKVIPRALLLSIAITAILYILTAFAALSILGADALGSSSAPIADVAAKALHTNSGQAFAALAIIAIFSTANTVLLLLVTTSRLLYGIAEEHALPKILAAVDNKHKTPYVAIAFTGLATIAFVLLGNIEFAARLTDFAIFIVFTLVNLAVILLRFHEPLLKRPFKVPFSIARLPIPSVLGILTCAALFFNLGVDVLIGGTAITILGVLVSFLVMR